MTFPKSTLIATTIPTRRTTTMIDTIGCQGSATARWARRRLTAIGGLVALLLMASVVSAAAETLLMPKRDGLKGTSLVVWGVTTQANGTPYVIDFGEGPTTSGTVLDRSFISFDRIYATSGNKTITLTVGSETATVKLQIFDSALLTADNLRSLKINMAIQDGLRWLWTAQASRAVNFPAAIATNWGRASWTALVTLAFQNHGYRLANDGSAPTGIYEKYIVRRGLNQLISGFSTIGLNLQAIRAWEPLRPRSLCSHPLAPASTRRRRESAWLATPMPS